MKYVIEATIPVVQYGNIKPMIEVDSPDNEEEAIETIKRLWDRFGEQRIKDSATPTDVCRAVEVDTFTGEKIFWNAEEHTYTDMDGNVLLSGSKYASQNSPQFPKDSVLTKMSEKYSVSVAEIEKLWEMKSSMALDIGNAIHKALEMYHLYSNVGEKLSEASGGDNYSLPKQPYLRRLVEDFVNKFGSDAMAEVVVSDVANGLAGTVDRLVILDKDNKKCRVGDYKSNTGIKKSKIDEYQKQLSFYAKILSNKGWTVEGLDLFYLDHDESWVKEELDVLDIEI